MQRVLENFEAMLGMEAGSTFMALVSYAQLLATKGDLARAESHATASPAPLPMFQVILLTLLVSLSFSFEQLFCKLQCTGACWRGSCARGARDT